MKSPSLKTIGEIKMTNTLSVTEETMAYDAAIDLVRSGMQGLSVLSHHQQVIGKVTEMNLLKALIAGKNLEETKVGEIMSPAPPIIDTATPLQTAVEIMDSHHLLRLPVIKEGLFIGNITRHDLLRAWLGVWNPWNIIEGSWICQREGFKS